MQMNVFMQEAKGGEDGFVTVWMYVALVCVFEWLPKILYGGNSLKKDIVSVVLAPN